MIRNIAAIRLVEKLPVCVLLSILIKNEAIQENFSYVHMKRNSYGCPVFYEKEMDALFESAQSNRLI